MIKLFRRIRQSLITQSKFNTYLLYAIGEIVLVVIGILIALQINNWNQERIRNNQEQQILRQLKSEFKENLKELGIKTTMRKNMIYASDRLFEIKKSNKHKTPVDSIRYYISCTYYTPTFDPVIGTTNELLASGNLYIINNNDLKTRLTNWSGQVNRLTEYEQDLRQYNINNYDPYLTKNYSIKALFDGVWQQRLLTINEDDKASAVNAFIKDINVDDYIFTIVSTCFNANEEAVLVKKNIEEILLLINREIND